jgi:3-hydroxyacyl-[acyl-carrier-protein] dehydratase
MEVELDRMRSGIYKFKGVIRVDGEVVCEAELMCTMRTVS